jgi:hypothetical protein
MYLRKVEQGFISGNVVLQKENLEAFPVDVGVMHSVVTVNLSNNFIATVSPAAMHMYVRLAALLWFVSHSFHVLLPLSRSRKQQDCAAAA